MAVLNSPIIFPTPYQRHQMGYVETYQTLVFSALLFCYQLKTMDYFNVLFILWMVDNQIPSLNVPQCHSLKIQPHLSLEIKQYKVLLCQHLNTLGMQ